MLNTSFINQLKQTNISVNSEKTAQRVDALWTSAKNTDKRAVIELAGVASATIYRVYNTGHISAKLAVAMAQVLEISPFYLTAESDEPGAFGEDVLKTFLAAHGYDALAQDLEPKRRRAPSARREKKQEAVEETKSEEAERPVPEDECAPEIEIEVFALEDETGAPEFEVELCDEDILTLLHALRLRAACGVEVASAALKELYAILLS